MTKKWEVTVNGTNNVIEYKAGFGAKILVNGQAYKVKSQNWWVMMVDYPRSKVFQQIIDEAEQDLRDLMNIPDNYKSCPSRSAQSCPRTGRRSSKQL